MINLYSKNWNIDNVDTILFDKDGTFIDSHIYWGRILQLRVKAVMRHYNIADTAFKDLCLSMGYNCETKQLIPEGPIAVYAREVVINTLIKAIKRYNVEGDIKVIEEIFKEVHGIFLKEIYDYLKLIDGTEDLFMRLKERDIKLAVVTSDVCANTKAILEHFNLEKYFDLVIGKDNCTKAKETGEPAVIAMKELGANPKTTISLGDAPMDYKMAKNAGLKGTILVSTGQIPIDDLQKYSPYTVKSLTEVHIK